MLPTARTLMGPGPSDAPPEVLAALSQPLLGHLDPEFLYLLDEVSERLRTVYRTTNPVTFPISGTGSAGLECVVVNLVRPGDDVVVGVNGVFGGRLAEVARRAGATVHTVEAEWGRIIDPEVFLAACREHRPSVAFLVHAETSTGVLQPVQEIAAALRDSDTLLALDCVTSLAGSDVDIDGWGIDAAYSGTQKCLSVPPGLSPVTFGPRAVERIRSRPTPCPSWYLDVNLILAYVGDGSAPKGSGGRTYHHTAPISMLYALHAGLGVVLDEGLDARIARHQQLGTQLQDGLTALGMTLLAQDGHRLPQLTAVALPDGVNEGEWRARLLHEHAIEVGGGLGAFAGKAWRIGLMGHTATQANVTRLLDILKSWV